MRDNDTGVTDKVSEDMSMFGHKERTRIWKKGSLKEMLIQI